MPGGSVAREERVDDAARTAADLIKTAAPCVGCVREELRVRLAQARYSHIIRRLNCPPYC